MGALLLSEQGAQQLGQGGEGLLLVLGVQRDQLRRPQRERRSPVGPARATGPPGPVCSSASRRAFVCCRGCRRAVLGTGRLPLTRMRRLRPPRLGAVPPVDNWPPNPGECDSGEYRTWRRRGLGG